MKLLTSLLVVGAVALTGCGGGADSSTPAGADNSSTENPSTEDPSTENPSTETPSTETPSTDTPSDYGPAPASDDSVPTITCSKLVDNVSDLKNEAKTLVAGDTLCLKNGIYTDDISFDFEGIGTIDKPITIAAQTSGGVTFKGGSFKVDMGGDYLVLQGFILRDGPENTFIKFDSDVDCNNCRVTEMSIIDMGADDPYDSEDWIELKGVNNRIDHSWFSGKTSAGLMIAMKRYASDEDFDEETFQAEYAMIDHNYFGDRAPAFGRAYPLSADNGYEAIRLGVSKTHSATSYSSLEYNYFERIQGEAEIVSNKATNNTIRYNTVRDSYGSIVTRHGANTTITNNYMIGDDHPFSGGIRLTDDGHIVTNNYIEGARYSNSNWNGGIVLSTGDGSGRTENGYQDVFNVLVANNTIVDSVNSIHLAGGKEDILPTEIYMVNNLIQNAIGPVIRTNEEPIDSSSLFAGNYVFGQSFSDDISLNTIAGFTELDAMLTRGADNLFRPNSNSPDLSADTAVIIGDFSLPTDDMDGQTRTANTLSGSDEVLSGGETRSILTAADVGPKNYKPTPGKQYVAKVELANFDFDSGDMAGWDNSGASIVTGNDAFSRNISVVMDANTDKLSQTVEVAPNTHYTVSAFMKGSGQIKVEVGGETFIVHESHSSYKFTSLSFNSGSGTTAIITASVAETLDTEALLDSDFEQYEKDESTWTTVQGADVGYVTAQSNSASDGGGSARLGYRIPSHDNGSPSISQSITVDANTDFAFSLAMLVKKEGLSTATLRIEGNDSVLVDDVQIDYWTLPLMGLDDDFRPYTNDFNSGDNTELTVTVTYNPHSIVGEQTIDTDGYFINNTEKVNAFYLDDISLIYQVPVADATEAYFDSFRLVSHALSPVDSYALDD